MDKRASLRREFDDKKANTQASIKSEKMHSEQLARFDSVEETIANAVGAVLNYLAKGTSKVELTNQLDSIRTPDTEKVVDELKNLSNTVTNAKTDQKPVIEALNSLKREITLLPAKMPKPKDQKDSIKVSNLSEVKLDTSNLEKAIKALDLKVDAPIVNVDKPDLKPLQNVMLDVLKAIKNQKQTEELKVSNLSEIKPTNLSNVEKKQDKSNEYLKIISEKKFGGGGGGGNGTPYTDASGTAKNVILTSDGRIPIDIDMASDGIATATKQDDQITQLANLLTELKQKTEPSDIQNIEIMNAIRVLLQQTAMPPWYDPTTATLRVGSHAVTLSSTNVTTVTNLTNFGTSPADVMARDISINTWANNCRTTIT